MLSSSFPSPLCACALQIPPAQVRSLLLLPPHGSQQQESASKPRLDFRSDEFVIFINNIERDPLYRGWPTNLQEVGTFLRCLKQLALQPAGGGDLLKVP